MQQSLVLQCTKRKRRNFPSNSSRYEKYARLAKTKAVPFETNFKMFPNTQVKIIHNMGEFYYTAA